MKRYSVFLAMTALVIASLACQTVMGGGSGVSPQIPNDGGAGGIEIPTDLPTVPPITVDGDGATVGGESEFPLPDDAFNVVNIGGVVNFQTKMKLDEAIKFYQEKFTDSGYAERTILTTTTEKVFSMVYDGHVSGKAIVIQGVDLEDGSVNIIISLQDI